MLAYQAAKTLPETVTRISAGRAAWLQLAPGLATLPAYALIAYLLSGAGIPNIFALALSVLFVETPVSWMIIARQTRKETGARLTLAQAFPWTAAVPWWLYLLIGLPVMVFSVFMVAGVSSWIQQMLLIDVFSWVPEWFVMRPDPAMFFALSQELLLALWALMLVSMVLVGGFTQELYSRGFLLPRMAELGRWAPAYNALLFAVFHVIAPWNWGPFFLMALPWAYLVWWRQSVKIGLFVHVGMLALQWLGMTLIIFGWVPAPA